MWRVKDTDAFRLAVITGDTTGVPAAMHLVGGNTRPSTLISYFPSGVDGTVYGLYALGWDLESCRAPSGRRLSRSTLSVFCASAEVSLQSS